MRAYLLWLGALIVTLSLIGGALYLSASYGEYLQRLQATGAPPGSAVTMLDLVKWELAKIVGTGMLFGGVGLGSLLLGMGWIGKTLEELRDELVAGVAEGGEPGRPPAG